MTHTVHPIDTTTHEHESLARKVGDGKLTTDEFQKLTRGQAVQIISLLVTGGIDQRENLIQLMQRTEFAELLAHALNDMPMNDRMRLLRSVGELPEQQVYAVRNTLTTALGGMVPSRLYEMLRESLLSRDSAAVREVNKFLECNREMAARFLMFTVSNPMISDSELEQLIGLLTQSSINKSTEFLAINTNEESRSVFRRFSDIIYHKNSEQLRQCIEIGIDSIPDVWRQRLLVDIISDPFGNRQTDRQVNKAQRLIAEYLERKGRDGIRLFLKQLSQPEHEKWFAFFCQNIRDETVLKLAIEFFTGNSTEVDKEKKENSDGRPSYAMLVGKLAIQLAAVVILGPAENAALNWFFSRKTGPSTDELVSVEKRPDQAILLASQLQNDRSISVSSRLEVRALIDRTLMEDPNGLFLYFPPSGLKNILKAYMHEPANLETLMKIVTRLTPQMSAKLARALGTASAEVAAETKAGTWVGDVLKGLTVSGKFGYNQSTKIGTAIANEGERTTGFALEIAFSWSPAAIVAGARDRGLNRLTAELNGFMNDWIVYLNKMSPNQKYIFLDEMKDLVTLKPTT